MVLLMTSTRNSVFVFLHTTWAKGHGPYYNRGDFFVSSSYLPQLHVCGFRCYVVDPKKHVVIGRSYNQHIQMFLLF